MKFLLDESADLPLAAHLRDKGHDVTNIVRDYSRSIKDTEVLTIAVREERILISNDKDFGELVFHRRLQHAGIILFRLEDEPLAITKHWLDHVITQYRDQLREFIVITDRGVRVRSSSAGQD